MEIESEKGVAGFRPVSPAIFNFRTQLGEGSPLSDGIIRCIVLRTDTTYF